MADPEDYIRAILTDEEEPGGRLLNGCGRFTQT